MGAAGKRVRARLQRSAAGRLARVALPSDVVFDASEVERVVALADEIQHDAAIDVVLLGFAGGRRPADRGPITDAAWVERFDRLTQPVVASIGSDLAGEAAELALVADIRIATRNAGLRFAHLADGALPRQGATQRLPRLVGSSRALDLLLSGRRIGAAEALRWGLFNHVCATAELDARVSAQLAGLLDKAPLATQLAKEAVREGADMTMRQGLRLEEDLYALLQTTADRAEGVRAHLGRRRARFRGE